MRGLSQWVHLYTRAQINFGDLNPYLTYALITITSDHQLIVSCTINTRTITYNINNNNFQTIIIHDNTYTPKLTFHTMNLNFRRLNYHQHKLPIYKMKIKESNFTWQCRYLRGPGVEESQDVSPQCQMHSW